MFVTVREAAAKDGVQSRGTILASWMGVTPISQACGHAQLGDGQELARSSALGPGPTSRIPKRGSAPALAWGTSRLRIWSNPFSLTCGPEAHAKDCG